MSKVRRRDFRYCFLFLEVREIQVLAKVTFLYFPPFLFTTWLIWLLSASSTVKATWNHKEKVDGDGQCRPLCPVLKKLIEATLTSRSTATHLNQKYRSALPVKISATSVVKQTGGRGWVTSSSQPGSQTSYSEIKGSAVSLLIPQHFGERFAMGFVFVFPFLVCQLSKTQQFFAGRVNVLFPKPGFQTSVQSVVNTLRSCWFWLLL